MEILRSREAMSAPAMEFTFLFLLLNLLPVYFALVFSQGALTRCFPTAMRAFEGTLTGIGFGGNLCVHRLIL